MSASADRRPRTTPGRILAVLLGVVPVVACTPATGPLAPTTAAPAAALDPEALLLTAPSDPADPGARPVVDMVRANLAAFDVAVTDTGRTAPLAPARRAVLGESAVVRALRVTTWVAGEPQPASHTVWVTTTTRDGRPHLAGFSDGPRGEPEPLWAIEPVTVARGASAAVVTTRAHDAQPWLEGLERAAADLRAAGIEPPPLVAEVPSSSRQLERVAGTAALGAVGAACWAFGDGSRILVNPGPGAAATGAARQFLLTHEAVHAATGSAHHGWPAWFVEGYADAVAARAQPEVGRVLDDQLRAEVRDGAPTTVPTDAELDPTRPDVAVAYGRARVAVRALGEAAPRVQAELARGVPLEQALGHNGWTLADVERATAAALAPTGG